MIATAWRSLGWFLTGVAVALGLLLVPLRVAAERRTLDRTLADIRQARRDIRALDTEFDTRANMAQLEQWNGDTLKLTAPTAAQFVRDEAALASLDARGGAPVQTAALVMPMAPVAVAAPVVATASTQPMVVPAVAKAAPRAVAVAAATRVAPAPASAIPARVLAAVTERPALSPAGRPHAQTVALLSDHTVGDILSGARIEASALR